jgi:hypothetical protein
MSAVWLNAYVLAFFGLARASTVQVCMRVPRATCHDPRPHPLATIHNARCLSPSPPHSYIPAAPNEAPATQPPSPRPFQVASADGGSSLQNTLSVTGVLSLGPLMLLPYSAQLLLEGGLLSTLATLAVQVRGTKQKKNEQE